MDIPHRLPPQSLRRRVSALAAAAVLGCAALGTAGSAGAASRSYADHVYVNGYIYTVDPRDSVQSALAVRAGAIVFVGGDAGARRLIGPRTEVQDLHGRMMMPGLVDGHMHPLAGGLSLLGCDLKYERLSVQQVLDRIQGCLDATRDREPDGWLEVRNWFQEAMIGGGVMDRRMLDALRTRRPILVLSSFGHTALVNSRALELAHVTAATPNPKGGEIARDGAGRPTGILQDGAIQLAQRAVPGPTAAEDIRAAESALAALKAQGITTFLDAAASPQTLAAFAGAEKEGQLTARAHFAVLVEPAQAADPHDRRRRTRRLPGAGAEVTRRSGPQRNSDRSIERAIAS